MSQSQSPAHALEAPDAPTLNNISLDPSFVKIGIHDHNEPCIPPQNPNSAGARALVLCFDGTGDQFDSDMSNVVEFFSLLKKGDPDKQLVYYQSGIGTYVSPQIVTPLALKVSKLLDEAFAWNISSHVMDGYHFLMQNYRNGDKISIFGFSRGAYTAQALAGMVHKVGLLPAWNHQQIPLAYKLYTRTDFTGWEQSNEFKRAFSIDISVYFLGVWDTVGSIGLVPRGLPFTVSNSMVYNFRHAISLDERRAKFKTTHWRFPSAMESRLGVTSQRPSENKELQLDNERDDNAEDKRLLELEHKYKNIHKITTDIEEVWFAGCHCDVGGGSVKNGTPHALARISLRWMVRECFKAGTGIVFVSERLQKIGLDPKTLYPYVLPRPDKLSTAGVKVVHSPPKTNKHLLRIRKKTADPSAPDPALDSVRRSEEEYELRDAMAPIYDQLKLKPFWWIMEFFPVKQNVQQDDRSYRSQTRMNLGKGRSIPVRHLVKVHRSVELRMAAEGVNGKRYEPKASLKAALESGNVEWVE